MGLFAGLLVSLLVLCASWDVIHGASGTGEAKKTNKFREREASDDMLGYPKLDEDSLLNTKCPKHVELRWQTELSSSVYAAPLIADINSDGKLEVVVPSFVHYLEVLEGSDGDKLPGWPAFHQSTVHSSPLLYDLDRDGMREIALATYNGVINFFRASGYVMMDKLEVPRRKVRKDWYVGLHQDPMDRSHPDVHDDLLVQEASVINSMSHINGSTSGLNNSVTSTVGDNGSSMNVSKTEDEGKQDPAQAGQDNGFANKLDNTTVHNVSVLNNSVTSMVGSNGSSISASKLEDEGKLDPAQAGQDNGLVNKLDNTTMHHLSGLNNSVTSTGGNNGLSMNVSKPEDEGRHDPAQAGHDNRLVNKLDDTTVHNVSLGSAITGNTTRSQRRLLEDTGSKGAQEGTSESHASDNDLQAATVENNEALEEDADSSFDLFRNAEDLPDDYGYDYDDYIDESMWGNEEWTEVKHEKVEDYVNIDSHILSTPVIADIDNDGTQEMIVAVSYFFDRSYYDNREHSADLGGIDIEKYVACGIVVFNLDTKEIKWTADLDLSTNTGNFSAHIFSSPTVVDLDGDGNMDILVGTLYGLFYILDHHGKVRERFPLEMARIHGSVVAADINDDGKIEIVTADSHGNVAAWTAQGDEIWEVHLKSSIPQGPTVGDVNGDSLTEVIIPTVSGNIYVLSGRDGSLVHPFPYRTHERVMSPVLLVDLSTRDEKSKGLTLVTTSFDGYLYLIDGVTACADVVDLGETSYSMVMADNVDGGDDLDLIVTTMNGNVFCFSTASPHHPLKEWRLLNQGRNNAAYRYNREGIYVSHASRAFRDEGGKHFWVEMEIVDKYRVPSGSQGPYNVTTTLLVPGNYQGERRVVVNQVYHQAGKQRVKLPTVPLRTTGTVLVEMVDKNGLYFSDEFSLTFHFHFHKLLKWLVLLPMLGMFTVLVILRPQEGSPLPSYSRYAD